MINPPSFSRAVILLCRRRGRFSVLSSSSSSSSGGGTWWNVSRCMSFLATRPHPPHMSAGRAPRLHKCPSRCLDYSSAPQWLSLFIFIHLWNTLYLKFSLHCGRLFFLLLLFLGVIPRYLMMETCFYLRPNCYWERWDHSCDEISHGWLISLEQRFSNFLILQPKLNKSCCGA